VLHTLIDDVFAPLYGKPCWDVVPGYASFLTLEFGMPHLVIDEPKLLPKSASLRRRRAHARRRVTVRGDWHLWIYCCTWRVLIHGELIGDDTTARRIKRAAHELDGQALQQVIVNPEAGSSVFVFDLGGHLETRPYNRDSEQWHLYEPSGNVFTYRADGYFSHEPGNTVPEQILWRPLSEAHE